MHRCWSRLPGRRTPSTTACPAVDATDARAATPDGPSAPYELLGIDAAQDQVARFAPADRMPVRCGSPCVSSGVQPGGGAPSRSRAASTSSGVGGEITDPQGTEVAGLVAGAAREDEQPVGIAPRAQVVDVRVFVDRDSNEAREQPATPTPGCAA